MDDTRRNIVVLAETPDTVVIRGIRIAFNAGGGIDLYSPVPVTIHPPANDPAKPQAKAERLVGDRMDDGTIYAGISPDTNTPMYTTPADAPLTYTFHQARQYALKLDAHGHQDWRVPMKAELNVLFQNRAAIGGFNETSSNIGGWYWSSTEYGNALAWEQRFSNGRKDRVGKENESTLRCVCGGKEVLSSACPEFVIGERTRARPA